LVDKLLAYLLLYWFALGFAYISLAYYRRSHNDNIKIMEEEIGYLPENMKPKVLYHASQNREIDVLEPRADTVRDKAEGPVVFA